MAIHCSSSSAGSGGVCTKPWVMLQPYRRRAPRSLRLGDSLRRHRSAPRVCTAPPWSTRWRLSEGLGQARYLVVPYFFIASSSRCSACRTRRSRRSAVPGAAHPRRIAPPAAPRPSRPTAGSASRPRHARDAASAPPVRPPGWRRCGRLAVGGGTAAGGLPLGVGRRRSGGGGVGTRPEQLGERVAHRRAVADLVVVHHRHADQPRIRRRRVAGARRGVNRFDVEQPALGHRQRQQIAPPDAVLVVAADDAEVLADRGVGGDRVVGQLRPVDLTRNRQHGDLAVRRRDRSWR